MDTLNIVQWNAQSLISNKHILIQFLYEHNIHIAIICETWLRPGQSFNIKGYKIERNDTGSSHNGVAVLIRNSINHLRINTYFDNSLQNICVQVKINNRNISIVSFYCPTNSTPVFDKHKFDSLIKSIPSPMIFAGDFNAHHTSWGCNSDSSRGKILLETIDNNNLVLLNDGQATTVGSQTWRPNALDLTLVSPSIALCSEWWVHDDPLGSYHLPVMIKMLVSNNNSNNFSNDFDSGCKSLPIYPNYKRVDWQQYVHNVDSLLLNFNHKSSSAKDAYTQFCSILLLAAKNSIPKYKAPQLNNNFNETNISHHKNRLYLPWWNQVCAKAVQNSKEAYVRFKNDPSLENYIEFKKLQASKKLTLKSERRNSWMSLCNSFNRCTPVSIIWKYMRKFNKTFVPNDQKNNSWTQDFLQKYTPDFVSLPFHSYCTQATSRNSRFLSDLFTLQEIKSAITTRRDTAFGLDGIPYMMFKKLSITALNIFLDIVNSLWANNEIPADWKTDCIIPILKPNKPKGNPESYRPIALTSCVGKIFEQLLKQRLEFYVEKNNILPSNQFGFRRGRSARESICQLHLDIKASVEKKNFLLAVFFDIAGAFNSVNIRILADELSGLGFPGKIINWIYNFLSDRKVFVKSNYRLYGPRFSSLGVCQGGILSPLIYILYIHRLNSILGTEVKNLQFADDLVVYVMGNKIRQSVSLMNCVLEKLFQYFSYLNLSVNANKSKVVIFGKNNVNLPTLFYNSIPLPVSLDIKFLGVIFCKNLSWKKYVECITMRANKAFNILKSLAGTTWGADPKVLLMLYKSLIRSHFEYGFTCFASDSKLIDKIEKIQNKSMRLITGAFCTTPINTMQLECRLPPIGIRFSYLKERFILKLYSSNSILLTNLLNFCELSPMYNSKQLYILQDLLAFVQFISTLSIHKTNQKLLCYDGQYDCKFPAIQVLVDQQLITKQQVYQKLSEWCDYGFVYTDGAKNESSVSFAMYSLSLNLGIGFKIDSNASIYTAEAVAILSALKHIRNSNFGVSKWVIISDSMSVLRSLENHKINANTSYLIYEIKKTWLDLFNNNITVVFMWVPAHIGVLGNERADFLATQARDSNATTFSISLPYTDATRILKQRMCERWERHWIHSVQILNKGTWYSALGVPVNKMPWFCRSRMHYSRKFTPHYADCDLVIVN